MISIIVPLFNAEKFIGETLDSILSQDYKDFEVVAIDDCGVDKTADIVREYAEKDSRIRVIENKMNCGIAYSRNKGIKEARGEYIALLDDDDIMCPGRLKHQVEYLETHPEIGGVGANAIWIDEKGNIVREEIDVIKEPDEIKMFLLLRNIFNNGEMMVRKSVIEDNNLQFGENCYGMEDYYFWIHFSKVAKLSVLDEVLLKKRMYSSNETSNNRVNYASERKLKFSELQKMSLELSGFVVTEEMINILKEYFAEEQSIPADYLHINDIYSFLDNLIEQAKTVAPEVLPFMENWFLDIMEDWQRRTWMRTTERWGNKERGLYVEELVKGLEWTANKNKELEEQIEELMDQQN